jgi:hypothetical protein
MTTVSDVLRRAAQIHAERGGCKGDVVDDDGHVCLRHAVALAAQEVGYVNARHAQVVINEPCVRLHGSLPAYWNDHPRTTNEDVQKFLLRVADEVEFPA